MALLYHGLSLSSIFLIEFKSSQWLLISPMFDCSRISLRLILEQQLKLQYTYLAFHDLCHFIKLHYITSYPFLINKAQFQLTVILVRHFTVVLLRHFKVLYTNVIKAIFKHKTAINSNLLSTLFCYLFHCINKNSSLMELSDSPTIFQSYKSVNQLSDTGDKLARYLCSVPCVELPSRVWIRTPAKSSNCSIKSS